MHEQAGFWKKISDSPAPDKQGRDTTGSQVARGKFFSERLQWCTCVSASARQSRAQSCAQCCAARCVSDPMRRVPPGPPRRAPAHTPAPAAGSSQRDGGPVCVSKIGSRMCKQRGNRRDKRHKNRHPNLLPVAGVHRNVSYHVFSISWTPSMYTIAWSPVRNAPTSVTAPSFASAGTRGLSWLW